MCSPYCCVPSLSLLARLASTDQFAVVAVALLLPRALASVKVTKPHCLFCHHFFTFLFLFLTVNFNFTPLRPPTSADKALRAPASTPVSIYASKALRATERVHHIFKALRVRYHRVVAQSRLTEHPLAPPRIFKAHRATRSSHLIEPLVCRPITQVKPPGATRSEQADFGVPSSSVCRQAAHAIAACRSGGVAPHHLRHAHLRTEHHRSTHRPVLLPRQSSDFLTTLAVNGNTTSRCVAPRAFEPDRIL